jgi:hypothetical protein
MDRISSSNYWLWIVTSSRLYALPLLCALALAGCNGGAPRPQLSVAASPAAVAQGAPSLALNPPLGHAGIYVQVSGSGWPRNMLVVIALADQSGRSNTLAASDTDQSGALTTGFLYPIDERWLTPGPHEVIAETADGQLQTSAEFMVIGPGTEIPPAPAAMDSAVSDDNEGHASTSNEWRVFLPLVTRAVSAPQTGKSTNDHDSIFVADVTIPDNTVVAPAQSFKKTWRLKNTLSSSWGKGYQLVFVDGHRLNATSPIDLSVRVVPGDEVEISVNMTAPSRAGAYESYWRMRNAKGVLFGAPVWVKIRVR